MLFALPILPLQLTIVIYLSSRVSFLNNTPRIKISSTTANATNEGFSSGKTTALVSRGLFDICRSHARLKRQTELAILIVIFHPSKNPYCELDVNYNNFMASRADRGVNPGSHFKLHLKFTNFTKKYSVWEPCLKLRSN